MRQDQIEAENKNGSRAVPFNARMKRTHRAIVASRSPVLVLLCCLLSAPWATAAPTKPSADQTRSGPAGAPAHPAKRAPLPPLRPQAQQPTAPEPAKAPLPELPPLDTSVPPPSLPRASRERMRLCADEWRDMSREGQTAGIMWRDFATRCLTR